MKPGAPVLGVDVDSTVWDTGAWVRAAVLEVTGETLDPGVTSTWTHVLDAYGEDATTRVFDRVFAPARVRERRPYPGAPEALRKLQTERGIRVHFVTRNAPEPTIPHLKSWLREHFGAGVSLTVAAGDKLGVLRELGAFGMIDDRPDTIERVAGAGLWAATLIQPWNRRTVAGRGDVHGFSDWREVPALLPPLTDTAAGRRRPAEARNPGVTPS